ncbi:hypothetical protein CYMTET_27130 [Cymbomonas tetramitiformis]|uniref:Uncharacterized protein n=1 Tax=Cymbomonas tetramitiformis TaxID=36881 RepID=A0AAE0FR34_9CHLO|nr:hypothetical protein CYMTET_27130 [Cymbomonas tetramitiformis]|eukprot:gene30599-38274_t
MDLESGGLIHMGDLGLEDQEDVDPTDEFLSLTAAAMASDAMHGAMSPGVGNTPQGSSPPSEGGDDIPRLNDLAGIIEEE